MKKKNEFKIHGVLNIDKPTGMTSHDVISSIRKVLSVTAVGHTGTLDPLATGVLPICIGNATKLSEILMSERKTYRVTLLLGIKTDTYDITGEILDSKVVSNLSISYIEEVIKSFIGKQKQKPPIYSAIKINGNKAYELARKGIDIDMALRDIEIYDIYNLKIDMTSNKVYFDVDCSKGTYIRSLCFDIGMKLNTYAVMTDLRRLSTGIFTVANSIKLSDFIKLNTTDMLSKVITLEELYIQKPKVDLKQDDMPKLLNGMELNICIESINECIDKSCIIRLYNDGKFIGIGKYTNNKLKRFIICN